MNLAPFTSVLKNGQSVLIREVTPNDRHLLEIGYSHVSHQSRYFRFLAARHDLTVAELDDFTVANGPDHVAVGALFEAEPIGIARYVRLSDQDHSAEIALTIVDSHQNMGLGRLLLGVLSQFAEVYGISELIALVHRDNTQMLKLLGPLCGTRTMLGGAEIEIRFPVAQTCARSTASKVGDVFRTAGRRADIANAADTASQPVHPLEHWANLRQFMHFHEENFGITGADQSISVWVDDGGAIV